MNAESFLCISTIKIFSTPISEILILENAIPSTGVNNNASAAQLEFDNTIASVHSVSHGVRSKIGLICSANREKKLKYVDISDDKIHDVTSDSKLQWSLEPIVKKLSNMQLIKEGDQALLAQVRRDEAQNKYCFEINGIEGI